MGWKPVAADRAWQETTITEGRRTLAEAKEKGLNFSREKGYRVTSSTFQSTEIKD